MALRGSYPVSPRLRSPTLTRGPGRRDSPTGTLPAARLASAAPGPRPDADSAEGFDGAETSGRRYLRPAVVTVLTTRPVSCPDVPGAPRKSRSCS
jgi:hypothetical protein